MDFGKIATKGQKHIPTTAWNAMREVAQQFENGLPSFESTSANRNPFLVTIENATGASIEPFAVLEISDAMFPNRTGTDFLNEAINRGVELKGIKPSGEQEKNIAITLDGGPNGTLVQAVVVGAVPCKVMVETSSAENYKYAVPVANQTGYLKAAESGNIRILWKESGYGTAKWAYVLLEQRNFSLKVAKAMVNTDYSPEGATQLSTTATWMYTSTVDSYGVRDDANAPKVANPLGLPEGRPVVVAKCDGFSPDDKDDPYITQANPPDADVVAIAADTRDLFTAYSHHQSGTNMTGNPGDYKKGNLFYLAWDSPHTRWIPGSGTNGRLAVCQRDCPDMFGKPFLMPYYSLEMNYGLPPNKSTNSNEQFTSRCGVASGEHVLSNKRLDYHYCNGRYVYEPIFTFKGAVTGSYLYDVKIEIEGTQYDVHFSEDGQGANMPRFTPDIYIGDLLTVRVDASSSQPVITAINYPVDFQEGSFLLTNMYGAACVGNTWRGWEDVTDTYYGNLPANAVVCYIRNGVANLGTAAVGQQGVDIDLPEIWDMRQTLGLNLYQKVKLFTDGCIH